VVRGNSSKIQSRWSKKEDPSAFVLGEYTSTIVKRCRPMEKVREATYHFTIYLKENNKVDGRVF